MSITITASTQQTAYASRRLVALVFLFFVPTCLLLLAGDSEAATFSIGTNFTGTDKAAEVQTSGGGFFFPPDTMGAVGPNHVVELINGAYAVYNKANGALITRTRMHDFWNSAFSNTSNPTSTNSSFDPRILYDKGSNRWYAVAVDNARSTSSRVLVAVTTGSDPTAPNAWRGFAIDGDAANTRWADFPTLGINASGIFIGNTMFDAPGGISESTDVSVIGVPKSSLTAAIPSIAGAVSQEIIGPNNTGFTLQAAVDLDNSTLPLPVLSSYNKPSGFLKRSSYPANFFTSGALSTSGGFINVTARNSPPDAPQPGPKQDLNTGDNRFSGNVILQNGSLWATHSVDIAGRGAIEWYEINATTNAILQSGLIADPSLHLYFPSIAVNNFGDAVIGFSSSDSNTFVSASFVVGETTAGSTTFGAIQTAMAGVADYQQLDSASPARNRWGDYSATVIDPNNERSFWTFQEFVAADRAPSGFGTVDNNWAVQITQINIVPEPGTIILAVLGIFGCTVRTRRS